MRLPLARRLVFFWFSRPRVYFRFQLRSPNDLLFPTRRAERERLMPVFSPLFKPLRVVTSRFPGQDLSAVRTPGYFDLVV